MRRALIHAIYHFFMALPYTVENGLARPHYPRTHALGCWLIHKLDPQFSDGG